MTDDLLERLAAARYADPPDDDDPHCEWCGAVVPGGASAFAPYCSERCEAEGGVDGGGADAVDLDDDPGFPAPQGSAR